MTTTPTKKAAKAAPAKKASTSKKSTAHKVICTNCRHPKSFHKDSKACSAFGCECKRLRLK